MERVPENLKVRGPLEREEKNRLLKLFAEEEYGITPETTGRVSYRKVREEELPGLGRKEVYSIDVRTTYGMYSFPAYMNIPKCVEEGKKVPLLVFIENNPRRDTPFQMPKGIHPIYLYQCLRRACEESGSYMEHHDAFSCDRGNDLEDNLESTYYPVRKILEAGCATVAFYTSDVQPDRPDNDTDGILFSFDKIEERNESSWGAIAAWGYGARCILEAFYKDDRFSTYGIAGHSRAGKATLWASVNEERFQYMLLNNSGAGGVAVSRGKVGDSCLATTTIYPYWFARKYHDTWAERAEEMPFDQHQLLACLAPRKVYVTSASDDPWADPASEYLGVREASPAFGTRFDERMPEVNTPVGDDNLHYHIRKGGHDLTEYDWMEFVAFVLRNENK